MEQSADQKKLEKADAKLRLKQERKALKERDVQPSEYVSYEPLCHGRVFPNSCTPIHTHSHIHACTHIFIHAHSHTHTHTHMRERERERDYHTLYSLLTPFSTSFSPGPLGTGEGEGVEQHVIDTYICDYNFRTHTHSVICAGPTTNQASSRLASQAEASGGMLGDIKIENFDIAFGSK